ncbi:MAG: hypothetical protein JOS17DRAFT_818596 [Linnemannia elongata]|nr:MAG: hypothetical protein JOS17DRAFT_818596 [Linnemannia elongata]
MSSGDGIKGYTFTPGVTSLNQLSSGSAILYNSKIYIFGGFSSTVGQRGYQSFQSLPYIDIFNPAAPTSGIQLALGKYLQPRQNHCTVLTDSKKVLLFGGYDAKAKTSLWDLWSLDMITMTWTQIISTNPTTPRHAHTCNIAGISAAERAMLDFDKPSVHGNMWEAIDATIFLSRLFKSRRLSPWPLLTKTSLPDQFTGDVTIVEYDDQQPKLVILHKNVTTQRFMKAQVVNNSKQGQTGYPPL